MNIVTKNLLIGFLLVQLIESELIFNCCCSNEEPPTGTFGSEEINDENSTKKRQEHNMESAQKTVTEVSFNKNLFFLDNAKSLSLPPKHHSILYLLI